MQRGERRKILSRYIKFRLHEECKVRGVASLIARKTGFSTAHLTNVQKPGRNVGEDFAEAMAKYWGTTYGELDQQAARWAATAEGREAPPESSRAKDPRDLAAELAREAGVQEEAIQSVLEEPPSERHTLWWADRMRMRQLELMRGEVPTPASTRAVPDESGATRVKKKTNRG